MTSPVICITGIDTSIGKTIVTGLIGRFLLGRGENVITQKIVQTGCSGLSEEIPLVIPNSPFTDSQTLSILPM